MVFIGYVYIPHCSNGKFYTGSTTDLDTSASVSGHQFLLSKQKNFIRGDNFTRKNLPFKLVHVETFKTVDQAFEREKQIQGWSHKKKEALINSDINSLHKLSECTNATHVNSIYSHGLNEISNSNDEE